MHDLIRVTLVRPLSGHVSLGAAHFRYSSRAAFLDGLQLSRAAFEIARYRDLRFRSGKAVPGSWRIVESHRCIKPSPLDCSPQSRSFSRRVRTHTHEREARREKREAERHPYTFAMVTKPLVHRRPSISSSSPPSSSSSFRGEPIPQKRLHAFPLTDVCDVRVCMCVRMVYEERYTHVHRRDLCFYKRIRVGRGRAPVSIT